MAKPKKTMTISRVLERVLERRSVRKALWQPGASHTDAKLHLVRLYEMQRGMTNASVFDDLGMRAGCSCSDMDY